MCRNFEGGTKRVKARHTAIHATGQRNEIPAVTRCTQATVTTGPNREFLSEMISGSEPQKDQRHDLPRDLLDTKSMMLSFFFEGLLPSTAICLIFKTSRAIFDYWFVMHGLSF